MTQGINTEEPLTPFLIRATAIASLGGIIFGYDLGVISGALPSLTFSFSLTAEEVESAVAFLYIGSVLGAIGGGYACDVFGRKKAIILTDGVFLLGSLVLAGAPSYGAVLLGRILMGIAVSVSAIADVAYLTEISAEGHRGALVSCNEVCITLGFLLAYGTSYGVTSAIDFQEGWRIMFGLSGILAVIQACGMMGMPESPIWLDKMGRSEEAKIAWSIIREGEEEEADYEYDDDNDSGDKNSSQQTDALADLSNSNNNHSSDGEHYQPPAYNELYRNSQTQQDDHDTNNSFTDHSNTHVENASTMHLFLIHYRQVIIAAFLAIAQQLCGHLNILNFAPEIFAQVFYGSAYKISSGEEDEGADAEDVEQNQEEHAKLIAPTILLGLIKFLVIVFVIKKVDVYGRRRLLLCGIGLITSSLFLLGIIFAVNDEKDEDASFDTTTQILAIVGCIGVVAGYSLSYGPLTWLITSELFPAHVRGRALGASSILSAAAAILISYTFLSGQSRFGRAVPFMIYFFISFGSFMYGYVAIPDTAHCNADVDGGRSVDETFEQMWFWKDGGKCACCWRYCCCCFGFGGVGAGRTDALSEVQMEHCIMKGNSGDQEVPKDAEDQQIV
eukprot:CAMPEP_0185730708 /NCGR_PEP_ID=MMETSP1171-20130828/10744_1 /TAXON_ID=374046 /ORGANISM="Helicotheca tamensis, Strain CCMP826" /LENGTH=614 /DNA_ID=CAMNT_0028399819 /DNA_START=146 /DNA_END=1990 /DNA_ORIENTATION=+